MPISFVVEPAERNVLFTITDPHTYEECARALVAVVANPDVQPGFSLLLDCRLASPPDHDFIQCLASFFAEHAGFLGRTRCAIVARDDDAAFERWRGLERLTELKTPSVVLRTFGDMGAAESWLSRAPEQPAMAD